MKYKFNSLTSNSGAKDGPARLAVVVPFAGTHHVDHRSLALGSLVAAANREKDPVAVLYCKVDPADSSLPLEWETIPANRLQSHFDGLAEGGKLPRLGLPYYVVRQRHLAIAVATLQSARLRASEHPYVIALYDRLPEDTSGPDEPVSASHVFSSQEAPGQNAPTSELGLDSIYVTLMPSALLQVLNDAGQSDVTTAAADDGVEVVFPVGDRVVTLVNIDKVFAGSTIGKIGGYDPSKVALPIQRTHSSVTTTKVVREVEVESRTIEQPKPVV